MVDPLGFSLGVLLTLLVVIVHYLPGTEKQPAEDLTEEVIEQRAASVPETDFPEPMNRAVGGGGTVVPSMGDGTEGELEASDEEIEEEDGFDPAAIPEDEVETFEIEYAKEGETIEVANNEPLLDAGEDEGWDLPYACREGTCISCGGRIRDGHADDYVIHSNNDMLSEDELEQGYVLTCTAYPTASFSLDTNEPP